MRKCNLAIMGCGTVGGGVARIITQMDKELLERAGCEISIDRIVEITPGLSAERFDLPLDLFCGKGKDLSMEEANAYIDEILQDKNIDMVIETIGGTSDFIYNLAIRTCKAGKHFVTANKALLAERGNGIFEEAAKNKVAIGYEAAVCGAIPIIKTIKESFSGDEIESISGIMNGTSNYILTRMQNENLPFAEVLQSAQESGYAEADPTLDINGGDAAHKLKILMNLAFGANMEKEKLSTIGVQDITKEDIDFAREINCHIKLICYAKKTNGDLFATVCPMMVKKENPLAHIGGAVNAVKLENKYSGEHMLVGAGAGSSETASSIVADIVFIARYSESLAVKKTAKDVHLVGAEYIDFPYIITFETNDAPGITGLVTTAIGNQQINIDTVSHNRHTKDKAVFSVVTMPCSMAQLQAAIKEIREKQPDVLCKDPKIIPVLY
jgi:homoserine dehydrogenase